MHTNVARASSEINATSEAAKLKQQLQRTGVRLLGGAGPSLSRVMKQLATKISENAKSQAPTLYTTSERKPASQFCRAVISA